MKIKGPKIWPWMFKKEIIILYYGLRDKRTAVIAGLPVIISVIYLLSPIDLIPDFIPFFGYIDDFIVISLLLNLSIRLLPGEVREESLLKASRHQKKLTLIFLLIVIFFIALLAGLFFFTRYLINK
ncbi:MAG TPA: DUF1232 domain-containing protein [Puia sp.]|nr:DUF1232 domain-containing protein [Puia sp.]